jgi:hypothetical protein
MKTSIIKSESNFYVSFKRAMYGIMVIAITLALPLLGYLELSHEDKTDKQKDNIENVKNLASSGTIKNTIKL